MSLTFATNALHLANWGLSIGDIAIIAGAGRGIITWLTADDRDNNLLSFLNVTEKGLRFRRGIVDTVALNARWSKSIALFQNGQRIEHRPVGESEQLENVCRLTWIMTLIVAALDVSVSNRLLESIVVEYTGSLFKDSILDVEYLQHEIPQHIRGWRSAATVRNISPRARSIWHRLENQKNHHLPGFIPDHEEGEIVRFLVWLTTGETPNFCTSSSDLHSLATLLADIGFDRLRTHEDKDDSMQDSDESICTLIIREDLVFTQDAKIRHGHDEFRRGMRVPLVAMHETISLWPEPPESHNKLRLVFCDAQDAASRLRVQACSSPFGNRDLDPAFLVTSPSASNIGRIAPEVYRLIDKLLLIDSPEASHSLNDLISAWPRQGLEYVTNLFTTTHFAKFVKDGLPVRDVAMSSTDEQHQRERDCCMAQLRAFLLGYYYGVLAQVIDASRLRVKECFGSWDWTGPQLYEVIAALVKSQLAHNKSGKLYWRYQVMLVVAYLFAGAEADQLIMLKHGSAGLIAKLIVLSPGLLGEADTPEKMSRLYLLDVDPTSIPSNQRGIVIPGDQPDCTCQEFQANPGLPFEAIFEATTAAPDFTSHLEPAWGFDTNLCLVAYRYRGRLIHKVNPLDAEAAILEWWSGTQRTDSAPIPPVRSITATSVESHLSEYQSATSQTLKVCTALPSEFEGGRIRMLGNRDPVDKIVVIVASTKSLKRGLAWLPCITKISPTSVPI
ncbi:hypothetical protein LTR10_004555 [Elasticomyces elasticus]|nr:hypothetical protein LTR10_004555 [Elasticomyces elasticus]KAK4976875.1 hypothetical protein LTR42_002920 [Elasticomyces elasticus]